MPPLHLYGVVAPDHPVAGVTGLRRLELGPVAALAREVAQGRPLGPADLLEHTRTLSRLLQDGQILPFRFGTVAPDEEGLRAGIRGSARWYEAELRRLEGQVEMAVSARYREPGVFRRILDSSPRIRRLASTAPARSALPAQVQLGEMVAAELERQRSLDHRALRERLAAAASAVADRPPDPQCVERAAYLVANARLKAFAEALGGLEDEARDWLVIRATGPLPPFSFVVPPPGSSRWAS
jgi:hypothetical protein